MKTSCTRFIPLLAGLLLLAVAASAQGPGSGGPTPDPQAPNPTAVPIDGGASLLAAGPWPTACVASGSVANSR